MTRIAKLYAAFLADPGAPRSFREFVRIAEAVGFVLLRQSGSHRCYKHPLCPNLLVVQPRGTEAKPYQMQQLHDMIRNFGLGLD